MGSTKEEINLSVKNSTMALSLLTYTYTNNVYVSSEILREGNFGKTLPCFFLQLHKKCANNKTIKVYIEKKGRPPLLNNNCSMEVHQ